METPKEPKTPDQKESTLKALLDTLSTPQQVLAFMSYLQVLDETTRTTFWTLGTAKMEKAVAEANQKAHAEGMERQRKSY
jgi:hypothetical protein